MSLRSLQRPYIAFYQKHLGVINRTLKIDIVAPELLNKELIGAGDKEAFDRIIVNQGGIRAIERLFTEVLWRKPPQQCDDKFADILYQTGHYEILQKFITEFPDFAKLYQGILDNPDPCGNRYFANADRSAMNLPKADHKLTPKDLDRAREFGRFVCDIFWRSNHYATGFIIGSIPYCASLGAERRRHFLVMTNHHVWKKVKSNMHHDPDICAVEAVFTMLKEDGEEKRGICFLSDCLFHDEQLDYALLILHYNDFLNEIFPHKGAPATASGAAGGTDIQVFNELSKYVNSRPDLPNENLVLTLIGYPDTATQQYDHAIVRTQHAKAIYGRSRLDLLEPARSRAFYQCTSYHGSSGAPCFDIQSKRLYLMHCGGVGEKGTVQELEHGVLMYSVVKDMQGKVENNPPQCFNKDYFYQLFPDFKPNT